MEDRLNPIAPEDADESTLGGYTAVHGRAPSFEASDGSPYTVALEIDESEEEPGSYAAYLIFLRWANEGSAIMGHVETGDLATGATAEEARAELEKLTLTRVKEILDEAIARKRDELA
ncbi:MAG: hypothetical protein WD737_12975 [Gemmatimonadota bacterium]